MARYHFPWPSRQTGSNLNRIYIISVLIAVAAVIALIYSFYPFGKPVPSVAEGNADELPIQSGSGPLPDSALEAETPSTIARLSAEPRHDPNLIGLASKATIQSNPQIAKLIAEAVALVKETPDKVIEARDRLNDILLIPMSTQQRAFVKDQLSRLAEQWLFSKSLFPDDKLCGSYTVAPGEQLRTIGERHKVSFEILMQINNIRRPQELQAGQVIKVINGPFHAKIYRSTFTMDLYLQNTFVRSFPVGLGKPSKKTPTGLWRVKSDGKLISPLWTDPDTHRVYRLGDPDYPLGSRWIELEGIEGNAKNQFGFGIHGTKEPETIGTEGSRGCIRLHNGDAILLYNLLVPIHSLVRVEE